ncbi:hypothetical protein AB0F24_17720 [Streptomyces platensis]|uniref:hypothetical protein n=1 Tax=Streptomyces platensis TaxID=58346 RepID=UPI0033DFBF65
MKLFANRRRPQSELAAVRAENTDLRRELGEVRGRYLKALETIDRSVGDRAELTHRFATAIQRMSDAELVVKCISDENTDLKTENEHLRRKLAALTQPVARVIPLQKRGAA